MASDQFIVRPVGRRQLADFDDALWPVNVLLVLLASFVGGLIVARGDFEAEDPLQNAWVLLAILGGMVSLLAVGTALLGRVMQHRLQIALLFSLLAHLWVSFGMHEVQFTMAPVMPHVAKLDDRLPATLPDYHFQDQPERAIPEQFERPIQTALPASEVEPKAVERKTIPRAEPQRRPAADTQLALKSEPRPRSLEKAEVSAPHRADQLPGLMRDQRDLSSLTPTDQAVIEKPRPSSTQGPKDLQPDADVRRQQAQVAPAERPRNETAPEQRAAAGPSRPQASQPSAPEPAVAMVAPQQLARGVRPDLPVSARTANSEPDPGKSRADRPDASSALSETVTGPVTRQQPSLSPGNASAGNGAPGNAGAEKAGREFAAAPAALGRSDLPAGMAPGTPLAALGRSKSDQSLPDLSGRTVDQPTAGQPGTNPGSTSLQPTATGPAKASGGLPGLTRQQNFDSDLPGGGSTAAQMPSAARPGRATQESLPGTSLVASLPTRVPRATGGQAFPTSPLGATDTTTPDAYGTQVQSRFEGGSGVSVERSASQLPMGNTSGGGGQSTVSIGPGPLGSPLGQGRSSGGGEPSLATLGNPLGRSTTGTGSTGTVQGSTAEAGGMPGGQAGGVAGGQLGGTPGGQGGNSPRGQGGGTATGQPGGQGLASGRSGSGTGIGNGLDAVGSGPGRGKGSGVGPLASLGGKGGSGLGDGFGPGVAAGPIGGGTVTRGGASGAGDAPSLGGTTTGSPVGRQAGSGALGHVEAGAAPGGIGGSGVAGAAPSGGGRGGSGAGGGTGEDDIGPLPRGSTGLSLASAGPAAVGGMSDRPALDAGVPSPLARSESQFLHTQTPRLILERSGGRQAIDGRVRDTAVEGFKQRDREGRAGVAQTVGGTADSERAVELGLEFLAQHQSPDGSWALHNFAAGRNYANPGHAQMQSNTAGTGLALLTFLGAGYTHTDGKYRPVVQKGLNFLLAHQKPDGDLFLPQDPKSNLNVWLYSHGIASIALCEAYGMSRDSVLEEPAQRALNFIAASQSPEEGGWRYSPRRGSDTSVSGWQVMALKSGELAGLRVPSVTYRLVTRWLDAAQGAGGNPSRYAYRPLSSQSHQHDPSRVMTAEALLMRQYLGWRRDNLNMVEGAEWLRANLPEYGSPTPQQPSGSRDAYYWYYATQVMFQMQGDYWKQWNDRLQPLLLATQVKQGPLAGSWDPEQPVPDRWGHFGGRLYVTSLHLLMLEVYYRHLPIYRSLDGER